MTKRNKPSRSSRSRIMRPRIQNASTQRPTGNLNKSGAASQFWIYGHHAVDAALSNSERRCYRLLVTKQVAEQLSPNDRTDLQPEVVERQDISVVCGEDAVHQGIALLVAPLADHAIEDIAATDTRGLIVLDQATDPRNIGAVLRSARAFGAGGIVVQDRNAPPETGTMAKAASGALEFVPIIRVTNLARALWTLKDHEYWCVGLDGTAETDIDDAIQGSSKYAIVLGAEGSGLRRLTRETCDQLARIPIATEAESLNLSNAAAVALYVLNRRR